MTETVHMILDTSGSMAEDSKQHSAIYLLLSLQRYFKEKGIPVQQWQWSSTLSPLEHIPSLSWGGTLDSHSFSSFFQDSHQRKTVILLSDGDLPLEMDFSRKEECVLLLLGEEDSSLQWSFPHGRLWLPQQLNGHLTLFAQRHFRRASL